MQNKENIILETAEKMVRTGGYNAFSFREIAKIVGIKSSSVHYHFPTKADLGAAIAKHYTEAFLNRLGEPDQIVKAGQNPLNVYIATFKDSLINDGRLCLCGLLGAEIKDLPDEVAYETRLFFNKNIDWLTQAYILNKKKTEARNLATQTLACLEGAMMISIALNDIELFDNATQHLLEAQPCAKNAKKILTGKP